MIKQDGFSSKGIVKSNFTFNFCTEHTHTYKSFIKQFFYIFEVLDYESTAILNKICYIIILFPFPTEHEIKFENNMLEIGTRNVANPWEINTTGK